MNSKNCETNFIGNKQTLLSLAAFRRRLAHVHLEVNIFPNSFYFKILGVI